MSETAPLRQGFELFVLRRDGGVGVMAGDGGEAGENKGLRE